jgi:signal transduction histidine kinase
VIGYFDFPLIIILLVWAAIVHYKIERESATYVLIAFIPLFLWFLFAFLQAVEAINTSLNFDWLVVCSMFEVFLFGYVLARNYVAAFRKNNELREELITEREKSLVAVTQVQVRERRNLANLIHDSFGSKIAYVLQLMHLKDVALASTTLGDLATHIREVSHRIMPKSLDDGALVSSLESQIATLNSGLKNCRIELSCFDFPDHLNKVWIFDMYLITLEIINNSIKHGMAKSVEIEFYQYPDSYLFQFTDDGIGFNVNEVPKGFGLDNIERRVQYYKGSFEINSHKNEGTVIQITMPRNHS